MRFRVGSHRVRLSGQMVFPLLALAFAVAYGVQVRHLSSEALLLARPVLIVCVVLGLYVLVREGIAVERAGNGGDVATSGRGGWRAAVNENKRMLSLAMSVLLYVIGIEYVGFVAYSTAFLVVTMILFGVRRPSLLVLVPLSVVGSLYLVLGWWLSVPLPGGIVEALLKR